MNHRRWLWILIIASLSMSLVNFHDWRTARYWRKQYDIQLNRQRAAESANVVQREAVMSSWTYPAGYLNQLHKTSQVCVELHTISVGSTGALGPNIHVDGMYRDYASQYAYGPIDLGKVITAEFTLKQNK